ncbi:MAG: VOC family protein [Chloroflexi bacterium]|nr:VOC family protein [Chloroflexota bacterium]
MTLARGINYPAIIVRDLAESMRFYERLGLDLLYLEPNRDDPESTVAVLAFRDGDTFLHLVGPAQPDTVAIAEASPGAGSMQYLSLRVSLDRMHQIWDEMSRVGVQASEAIQRVYERLIFLEDPDRALITLTAWGVESPAGMSRAAVLQRAAALRDEAGAAFIEDDHLAREISEIAAATDEG